MEDSYNPNLLEQVGETVEYSKQYAQKRLDYLKLEVAEQSTKIFSGIVTGLIIGSIGSVAFLFLLIVLALWIGSADNSLIMGFGSVALILILTMIVMYLLRRVIITNPIATMIVRKIFE